MKKNLYLIIIICLAYLPGAGCKKNFVVNSEQEILFQMDYVNYAWGYQHYGFMIDNEGRILVYDNPDKWNFTDENYVLTADQVAENISMCRISAERIPEEELKKFASYIENIASSKVTAIRNTGADAGIMQIICFRYSGKSPAYRGYLIKSEGDISAENLNFFSKKVIAWLREIDTNIVSR